LNIRCLSAFFSYSLQAVALAPVRLWERVWARLLGARECTGSAKPCRFPPCFVHTDSCCIVQAWPSWKCSGWRTTRCQSCRCITQLCWRSSTRLPRFASTANQAGLANWQVLPSTAQKYAPPLSLHACIALLWNFTVVRVSERNHDLWKSVVVDVRTLLEEVVCVSPCCGSIWMYVDLHRFCGCERINVCLLLDRKTWHVSADWMRADAYGSIWLCVSQSRTMDVAREIWPDQCSL
jgi:hypothetical protein